MILGLLWPTGYKAVCTLAPAQRPAKNVLTFSALNTFRNCPRKFKHRYLDLLQSREKPESLS